MKNYLIMFFLLFTPSFIYAGDCINGKCGLSNRNKTINARPTISVTRHLTRNHTYIRPYVISNIGRNLVITTREIIKDGRSFNRITDRRHILVK